MKFSTKDIMDSVMDVDTQTRTVKAVWANIGNVDLDKDIISTNAFTKTIAERGPLGKKMIWSLVDHNPSIKCAFGKPKELYVEGTQLIGVTDIIPTEIGEDVLKLYEAGLINQHSIGFRTIADEMNRETGIRTIKEVQLFEGSAVLWGANPETPTLGLKSLKRTEPQDLVERLDRLKVAFKSGTFTDETFSLLEIEIAQIQAAIAEKSTQAVEPTPEPQPDYTDLAKAFTRLNQTLKSY